MLKKSELSDAQIDFIRRHDEIVETAFTSLGRIALDSEFDGLGTRLVEAAPAGVEGWTDRDGPCPGWFLDRWYVEEDNETIRARTSMDNFDMETFLHCIGAPLPAFKEFPDWERGWRKI